MKYKTFNIFWSPVYNQNKASHRIAYETYCEGLLSEFSYFKRVHDPSNAHFIVCIAGDNDAAKYKLIYPDKKVVLFKPHLEYDYSPYETFKGFPQFFISFAKSSYYYKSRNNYPISEGFVIIGPSGC